MIPYTYDNYNIEVVLETRVLCISDHLNVEVVYEAC